MLFGMEPIGGTDVGNEVGRVSHDGVARKMGLKWGSDRPKWQFLALVNDGSLVDLGENSLCF